MYVTFVIRFATKISCVTYTEHLSLRFFFLLEIFQNLIFL